MSRFVLWFVSALLVALSAGCSPSIGDSCSSSADCSVTGERICDLASPGGYCTVRGCESGTCPDDSVCVEWRFSPDRTAVSYCMATCGGDGDCRGAYDCVNEEDPFLIDGDQPIARVVDDQTGGLERFCVAVEADPLD